MKITRPWAAVVNKAGDKGASIQFDTRQLPVLTLWKNTDTIKQGYVTGIEPGTSYAYPVTIEREQKRVKQLQPGASAQFDLTLHPAARQRSGGRR
ncbi:thioredoxin-like protein [Klebsiella variicola]|uniref:Thioredoxin-like protein n=1 Tax=Klebsiella variicola TaxID=244366 RepID=A0A7H4MC36_KLEVA|nr:thioredoxin-like protein [Klebsiella variicola]